jgi:hypothetical protein
LLSLREPWHIGEFIISRIKTIPQEDIDASQKKGDSYPSVLILGPKLYLNYISKKLKEDNIDHEYQKSDTKKSVTIIEGYEFIRKDAYSNIGWRIVSEVCLSRKKLLPIVSSMKDENRVVDLLPVNFVEKHRNAILEIERFDYQSGSKDDLINRLSQYIPNIRAKELCEYYFANPISDLDVEDDKKIALTEMPETNETELIHPVIKLSSIMKSKGLQAGFVFIVGANNGELPQDPNKITDNEICQFIVALTRAKKKCYIIANRQSLDMDKDTKKRYNRDMSEFINWIDNSRINKLSVKDIK